LGAWGAVQACAAGLAIALGGVIRDSVGGLLPTLPLGAAAGYDVVYTLEILLLLATLVTMIPLARPGRRQTLNQRPTRSALHAEDLHHADLAPVRHPRGGDDRGR
jgi:BCD family chlorophyll transporter-like MFS transporter